MSVRAIVVVPTLSADDALWDCLRSLEGQTYTEWQAVIVDNSGMERVRHRWPAGIGRMHVLAQTSNIGFGAAVNAAAQTFASEFVAVINDDAVASPQWLAALIDSADRHPEAGVFASSVRSMGSGEMESAGMSIAADGTSKQCVANAEEEHEVLLASGSACMIRRATFHEIDGYDDTYFLYCEDTDLSLRARWAGWTCRYVAHAVVHHRYSHSAGRASALKAYLVERNRLFTIFKTFPPMRLLRAIPAGGLRYLHHLGALRSGHGAAAEFKQPLLLPWLVVKSHLALLAALPRLWRQRRGIRRRISTEEFNRALDAHTISLRSVAQL